ncbi:hypothetical protein [Janthinobacterium sp. DSP2-3-3]|uniref:hypothetical protein n=1 Tax=Janthinobacterium sp. DSP2-3-3 TaxID=2804596 RepID=UPI003CF66A02
MPATHTTVFDKTVSARLIHASQRLAVGSAVLLSLSACANFNTIDRTTALPKHGTAIHLDAPQRLAYADAEGVICAEPTPDALQTYISSLGASVSAADNAASVSNALQANSQSIGLHSQSITLMREHLFRICTFAQNNWLSDGDVMMLMARSQDLTLRVLAIEQLTGVMTPRTTAKLPLSDTEATKQLQNKLEQAKLDLNDKKTALTQLNDAAGTQNARSGDHPDRAALLEDQTKDGKNSSAPTEVAAARLAVASGQDKVSLLQQQVETSKVQAGFVTLPDESGISFLQRQPSISLRPRSISLSRFCRKII